MEPPPSLPKAIAPMPAASEAPAPPEEPPGVWSIFQGLRVTPHNAVSVMPFQPNSLVVVLPRMTAPASFSRATAGRRSVHDVGGGGGRPHPVGEPDHVDDVLDGDRYAVEWAERPARPPAVR